MKALVLGEEEEEKPDSIFTPKRKVPTRGHFCIIILHLSMGLHGRVLLNDMYHLLRGVRPN